MREKKFDFGIIGSGPAGYTAAIRASQLGKTVVLFEKENLGGVCLNKGCIPTKTFLYSADVYNSLKKVSNLGIEIENYSLNFEKVVQRKEKTVEKLRKSLEMLLKSYGIEIVYSEAKIIKQGAEKPDFPLSSSLIQANGEIYECLNVLAATGAEPKCVGGFEFDHEFILSSDDILELKTLPEKVLIVGSGAIGIEWARIFSAFGSEVTIIEIADRLLPPADFEISQRLERIFKMSRIKMFLSTSVSEIKDKKVTLSNGDVLEPDFVLFATGRGANKIMDTEDLLKIGDCSGNIQLAHFASHQGIQVVENIVLGKEIKEFITPSVVYGEPEIAWAGKCEQELISEKIEYKKSVFPISALGKAATENNLEGFVKILAGNAGKILGVHIISKEASALLHQLTIAMENGIKVEELKHCCFAHPTYSEGIYEALLGIDNQSLSLLRGQNA
ncbi:MAG: NAD(P)/FAD-dependent oxidoreductase [Candidatus Gastranaerophilaceae bacterium]